MRADGPGSATLVRLMAVENGRSVLRAANPIGPDIAVTRANETMIRGVVVFVWAGGVSCGMVRRMKLAPRHYPAARRGGLAGKAVVTGR